MEQLKEMLMKQSVLLMTKRKLNMLQIKLEKNMMR